MTVCNQCGKTLPHERVAIWRCQFCDDDCVRDFQTKVSQYSGPVAFLEEGVKIGRAMVKEQYAPLVAAAPDIIEYLREVSLTATDSPTLMQFEINRGFRDRTIIIQGWIQILEALKGGEA